MKNLTNAQKKDSAKNAIQIASMILAGAPMELRLYREIEGDFVDAVDKRSPSWEICDVEMSASDFRRGGCCTAWHLRMAMKSRNINQEFVLINN